MFVYLVYHGVQHEFKENDIIGVFDSYDNARSFELDYLSKNSLTICEWTEIRKVEVNKIYDRWSEPGEEV